MNTSAGIKATSEPRLLQLLTEVQGVMARLFDSRARHLGLSRPQWRVIAGLYGHNGMTQTELSEATAIARSPLGKIIDQLEECAYIERRGDPADRRVNRLHLTNKVMPLLAPARELAAELEIKALEGLPGTDNLADALEHLSTRLNSLMMDELRRPRGR